MPLAFLPAATRAFLVATLVALAADGLLAAVTGLADVADRGAGPPWWVAAHVVERGRWVVAAALLAAWLGRRAPSGVGSAEAWRAVGLAVMVGPVLWILAGWIVQAVLITVGGQWALDGQVFLSAGFYRRAWVEYVPWLLAGVTTRAVARHVA
ncbi:MAG: hypothetical protein AB7U83_18115 [Vicinamibacterales bacterium]